METQINTMPEMDWLTGLSSRAAFGRHVNQADRDRDEFAIAVLEIEDFAEINRQVDYESGDDLLRAVGQALTYQTSVNTFAARLGGAQFAVLSVQRSSEDLRSWIAPIVSAVKAAIGSWYFDLVDFTGDCLVEPELRTGAAGGSSRRVWSDADTALELAKGDALGGNVVLHDADDPRFIAIARQKILVDQITVALANDELQSAGRRIDVVGGQDPDWRWLRLGVLQPDTTPSSQSEFQSDLESYRFREGLSLVDTALVPASTERQLENWLVSQARRILTESGNQLRLTVPITREIHNGRAFAQRLFTVLERHRVPPSRMLFEVSESSLVRAGSVGREFSRQLERIGSGVVLSDCTGGWEAWQATENLPILYVKPHAQLVDRAASNDEAARRILGALIENAARCERELIAPPGKVSDADLAATGFSFRERLEPEL
ncbi:MAG: EAL domain-containing protein [Acidimicrobiales bacterium]